MEYLNYLSFLIPLLIAVVVFVFARVRNDSAQQRMMIRAYLYGMVSIVVVILVQLLASYFSLDNLQSLRRIVFYSLVIAGFFSEFSKFFFLKVFCYPDKSFRSPLDGILFSIMIAMGFATVNNILMLVNIPNLTVNNINALTSGPANVIFGGLMGFFIGLGKMRKLRWVDSMTGLAAAVFFHALYAFTLITKDYKLLVAFFIGSTLILLSLWIVSLRMHTEARMNEES